MQVRSKLYIGLVIIFTALHTQANSTPSALQFKSLVQQEPKSVVASEEIVLALATASGRISITGGKYSLNGATFTNKSGNVLNGSRIKLELKTASAFYSTTKATLKVGKSSAVFQVRTKSNPKNTAGLTVSFPLQTDLPLQTTAISEVVLLAKLKQKTDVAIFGGEYSINGGAFTSVPGIVKPKDRIQLRHVSSSNYARSVATTLNIGALTAAFTTKTLPDPGGDQNFQSRLFTGSGLCADCHNGVTNTEGKDVSIVKAWSSSIMANSARSPFWRAKVREELINNPNQAAFIQEKCTHCHVPMAFTESKQENDSVHLFDNGILESHNPYFNQALEGISCTVCHQIKDTPKLGTWDGFSGGYEIDTSRTIYGPFDNLTPDLMISLANYTPKYSPHLKESKLCATCHNLKAPFVDENGKILSTPDTEFVEIATYTEWEQSGYPAQNVQCQTHHMGKTNAPIARKPEGLAIRTGFSEHAIIGANKLMLDIYDNNRNQLGIKADSFVDTIAKTEASLSSAANITSVGAPALDSHGLSFRLKITSNVGHKLPTSVFAKRIVLHVTVKDVAGIIRFESGHINANGSVDGVDADLDGTRVEPHHDVITSSEQVQVYEAVPQDYRGNVTFSLVRSKSFLKDNRILPLGFDKNKATRETQIAGEANIDNNFIGGSDEIDFKLADLTDKDYEITAELVHQPLSYAYALDLFASSAKEITDFKTMYTASQMKSNRITSLQFHAKL